VPQTVAFLEKFCAERNIPFSVQRVESPSGRAHLNCIYHGVALALGTDRVAVTDSLDYIDATILSNMAFEGIFTGPSVCEQVQTGPDHPPITIVRPFCLLTDEEIQKTAAGCGFPNAPTGMRLLEEPFMEPARRAIRHMLADGNVRLNFFNAQFRVEKKYVGCGAADE
jgi:tRNA(Ile)-lysidine synthase TilS/MesJ